MKLKLLLCTLTAALCAACSVEAAPPEITADAAVIMDEKDGAILYEKNGTKKEYPASMTKIMTCILSIEKGNPYKTISVSANAADVESTALNGGEWITLDNLRNQMMMISDNGAATAIALWYRTNYLEARNDELREERAERARANNSVLGRVKNTAINSATRTVTNKLTNELLKGLGLGKKK